MKSLSSPSLLRVSISVASIGILVLLINPFANIFFGRQLNSPVYYIVLIVLSGATIVLGMLQVLGKAFVLRQNLNTRQASPDLLESDIYGEKLALHKLVSDIVQLAYPDLVSTLRSFADEQQKLMFRALDRYSDVLEHITEQDKSILRQKAIDQQLEATRIEALNNLTKILEVNAQSLSTFNQDFETVTQDLRAMVLQQQTWLKEHNIKTQLNNTAIKVTTEIDGVPITIEAPDVEKAGDMVDLMTKRIQTTSALASEKKAQSVVRESTGAYKPENNPEQAQ